MSWWDEVVEIATLPARRLVGGALLTDESRHAFTTMQEHWRVLFAWGIKAKIPSQHPNWEAWEPFEAEWMAGRPDVTQLQAQASGLRAAELAAKEKGLEPPAEQAKAPDIEDASKILKGAVAVDKAATEAGKEAKELLKKASEGASNAAASGIGAIWKGLPLWGKGAVVLTGVSLGASALNGIKDALPGRRRGR